MEHEIVIEMRYVMKRYALFMHHGWWKFKTINSLKTKHALVAFTPSRVRSGVVSKVMRYTIS